LRDFLSSIIVRGEMEALSENNFESTSTRSLMLSWLDCSADKLH
jgi:hypothetical protein